MELKPELTENGYVVMGMADFLQNHDGLDFLVVLKVRDSNL